MNKIKINALVKDVIQGVTHNIIHPHQLIVTFKHIDPGIKPTNKHQHLAFVFSEKMTFIRGPRTYLSPLTPISSDANMTPD